MNRRQHITTCAARRACSGLLGAGIVLLFMGAAPAALGEGQSFEVEVWAIRATKANTDISPELKGIAAQLKRQFKYTGFKLEKKGRGKVAAGKTFAANLVAGFKAKVTPLERAGGRVKFKLEVTQRVGGKEKRRLRTVVTSEAGKFQLSGGWKIDKKGDVLICAVRVR